MFVILRRTLLIISCVVLWTSCQQIASDDGEKIATREQIDGCLKKSKERLSLCGIPQQLDLPRCSFDSCYEAIEVVQDGTRERYFCSVADQNVQWIKVNTTADCTDNTDLTILPIEIEQNQNSESAVQQTPVSERPADQQQPPADQQNPPADQDDSADDSDDTPDANDSDDSADQDDSDDEDSDDSADSDDEATDSPDEADDSDADDEDGDADDEDSDDVISDEDADDSDDVVSDEDADDTDDDSDDGEEPADGGEEEPSADEEPAGGEEEPSADEEPDGGEEPADDGEEPADGGSGSVFEDILDGILGPFVRPT